MKQNHFIQPDKSILVRFKGAPTDCWVVGYETYEDTYCESTAKGETFSLYPYPILMMECTTAKQANYTVQM